MITKIQRNLLKDFVKQTNKHLGLYKESEIELIFYEVSTSCYTCDIKHFGKIIAENIRLTDVIAFYIIGYGMGNSDLEVIEIWKKLFSQYRSFF